ncbi:MAG TPA: hypothetical protein VFH48_14630 [Chloroflexota bacterium]|nr:hypothetical protein [Chloroflexota bacterium]
MIIARPSPLSAIEAMTEPAELARAQAHRQQFDRNWAWLKDHAAEIFRRHRGQYVVVAAEQKFVGDTAEEAWARSAEAQIADKGSFIMQVPKQGSGLRNLPPVLMVTDVTDPDELARADSQDERFGRNLAWFQEHGEEIVALYRGRWISIAGQEVFAADSAREAITLARAAYPEDDGRFTYCVPTERAARLYAH